MSGGCFVGLSTFSVEPVSQYRSQGVSSLSVRRRDEMILRTSTRTTVAAPLIARLTWAVENYAINWGLMSFQ